MCTHENDFILTDLIAEGTVNVPVWLKEPIQYMVHHTKIYNYIMHVHVYVYSSKSTT